ARSLIPKNYCVEDCNYLLDYYRLTGDNRLLSRNKQNTPRQAPPVCFARAAHPVQFRHFRCPFVRGHAWPAVSGVV
ncbi:hypothetical protein AB8S03_21265, partial [Klebsiella pneumoniae]